MDFVANICFDRAWLLKGCLNRYSQPQTSQYELFYRFEAPRASFFTFCLLEPRGVVRFGLAAAFLRAARFTFFRSAVSVIVFVFAICLGNSLSLWIDF